MHAEAGKGADKGGTSPQLRYIWCAQTHARTVPSVHVHTVTHPQNVVTKWVNHPGSKHVSSIGPPQKKKNTPRDAAGT